MTDIYPLVSVITICLNSEKTIKRTVESVFDQTYPNVEYIIIDGGSIDGTSNILSEYKKRFAMLVSEHDNGMSDAVNKGIQLSHGEYIQILNSDDYIPSDKIELSVKLLRENPQVGFVFGDIIKIDPLTKKETFVPGNPKYFNLIRLTMPCLNSTTMLAKKYLYDHYGLYDVQWSLANDYDWLLRISQEGIKGLYSNKIVTYMDAGGQSDKRAFKVFREVRAISIQHGLNPCIAYAYYCIRCVKQIIYKSLGLR
jgi:glycosyltransferase involved in cell wall biosynthesis